MKRRSKHSQNNDFFTIVEENTRKPTITAPHTLTPQEVISSPQPQVITNNHKALDALKRRMTDAVDSAQEQIKEAEVTEESDIIAEDSEVLNSATEEDLKEAEITPLEENNDSDVLDSKESLLDKCMPYLIEEDGTDTTINKEPLYKLQSVAEILKSDSEKFLEKLSLNYDIAFDDLGNASVENEAIIEEKPEENTIKEKVEEPVKEEVSEPKPVSSFEDRIIISDIDTPITKVDKPKNDMIYNTATITFTPVDDGGADRKLNVSTQTRPLNFTDEFVKIPVKEEKATDEVRLEENDFEEFVPQEEVTNDKEGRRILRKYSLKKRKSFLAATFSFLATIILCLNWIPPIARLILADTRLWMSISSAITFIVLLLNLDCFKSLKKIFSHDSTPDIAVSFSAVSVALYSVFGILNNESVVEMQIFLGAILSFRALGEFLKASYMVSNLKIALSSTPKNTLKLINDSAITYTLAENSVEGDALVAATQTADSISDFMKYSTYGTFIDGKMPFITGISLILSVITGIVCAFYFDGISYGFYAASVIQCLTALPAAFLIDNLPLYKAGRRLNYTGAMILGKTGAEFAEMANAAVINADKLFPAGSVTLHQMQALSPNNLEDTIVRAASLTESLGSTLAPIFKTIAGTGNITALPNSDTIKYEDKMGISGWVDDRLLFIGNRTLLEAHGITVPSLEVDRKILRQGYFPVYVATENRACALIIIQYNVKPEIAKELRRLTDSGVDLLVSSCDPNLTEEMICDYFGLYEDSVKVITTAGRHTHKNITAPAKNVVTPAVCGRSSVGIAAVLNCASRIKKSNMLLTISYILALILGTVMFAYSSFGGSGTLLSSGTALIYMLATTIISFLLYLIKRP